MKQFSHVAQKLNQDKKLVFTAMSKHIFYYRMYISKFVLEQGCVPINPFMTFDYFLLDTVDRDLVREANNNLVKRSDELWVFGPISDGVLVEIKIAQQQEKAIRFFSVNASSVIIECDTTEVMLENDVVNFKTEIESSRV